VNNEALFSARLAECNAPSPFREDDTSCQAERQSGAAQGVGESRLSDDEREAAILRAGSAMQAWYSRFRQSGESTALDMAHRHMEQMRALVMGRSASQVERMERERGLA
jgi:hypothetical protein